MKKTIFALMLIITSWQVYKNGILTVYSGSTEASGLGSAVVYSGAANDYQPTLQTPNYWIFGVMGQDSPKVVTEEQAEEEVVIDESTTEEK